MKQIQEQAVSPKLRLTMRGRIVIASIITVLLLSLWAIMATLGASKADAYANGSSASQSIEFEMIVAVPGDTLWDIATIIAPSSDPRDVIDDIVRFNQLQTVDLNAGQELAIPPKYAG